MPYIQYTPPRVLSGEFRNQNFLVPRSSLPASGGDKYVDAPLAISSQRTLSGVERTERWFQPPRLGDAAAVVPFDLTAWIKSNQVLAVGIGVGLALLLFGRGKR